MDKLTKNFIKILIILSLVYATAFLLSFRCNNQFTTNCLFDKQTKIGSDFYWNYNTAKYVASFGAMPVKVDAKADGGIDGSLIGNEGRIMWHSPIYYYIAALLIIFSRAVNINEVAILVIFSILIMLATNILFFIFVKKLSRKRFDNLVIRKRFVLYSSLIFAFLPMGLYLGFFVNNDPLFYFFLILSFIMFLNLLEKKNYTNAVLFGLVLGFGFLSRLAVIMLQIALFIYIISLHLKKKYNERNLLFTSLLISLILGSYTIIRNFFTFGRILGDAILPMKQDISIFPRVSKAFWGGIYGSFEQISILIAISAILLTLLTVYGLILYFKNKRGHALNLVFLIAIINLMLLIHFVCNFYFIFSDFTCMGSDAQSRLLIALNPFIAIFSSYALSKFRVNLFPFVLTISALFSIDFIFAFL